MSAEQKPFDENQENLEDPQAEEVRDEGVLESSEEPTAAPEFQTTFGEDEGLDGTESMGRYPARRGRARGRAARRGQVSALPTEPEAETEISEESTPEAVVPKTSEAATPQAPAPREEKSTPERVYNRGSIPEGLESTILGRNTSAESNTNQTTEAQTDNRSQDAISQVIAEYAQQHNAHTADPTERPNLTGPRQSYRVVLGPSSQPTREAVAPSPEPIVVAPRPEASVSAEVEAEFSTAPAATSEPAAPRARRRHRRETPASFAERVMGYTTARPEAQTEAQAATNPDNEATQQLPVVNFGETSSSEPEQHLSRTQRLRAKLGSVATAVKDFTANEQRKKELRNLGVMPSNPRPDVQPDAGWAAPRLEERRREIEANADSMTDQNFGIANIHLMSPEENAQHERGRGVRRRRMVGALGLAAASAGLMVGVSGDMSQNEAPRSSISANQLPGQQSDREGSSISSGAFERASEFMADQAARAGQIRERAGQINNNDKKEQKPSVSDAGHEKITTNDDGSITIELEKGGNYWEGVHEAERLLDIDDSATATANAVNTIGFEEGEDRNQKVGAKVTFKNIDGKLVATRS